MTQPSIDPSLGCRGSTASFPGLNSIFSAVCSCVHSQFMGVLLLVGIYSVIYFLPSVLFLGMQV